MLAFVSARISFMSDFSDSVRICSHKPQSLIIFIDFQCSMHESILYSHHIHWIVSSRRERKKNCSTTNTTDVDVCAVCIPHAARHQCVWSVPSYPSDNKSPPVANTIFFRTIRTHFFSPQSTVSMLTNRLLTRSVWCTNYSNTIIAIFMEKFSTGRRGTWPYQRECAICAFRVHLNAISRWEMSRHQILWKITFESEKQIVYDGREQESARSWKFNWSCPVCSYTDAKRQNRNEMKNNCETKLNLSNNNSSNSGKGSSSSNELIALVQSAYT